MKIRSRDDNLYRFDARIFVVVALLFLANHWLFSQEASHVPSLDERLRVLQTAAPRDRSSDEQGQGFAPDEERARDVLAGVFESGDTVLKVMNRAGIASAQAMPFVSSLGTLLDFRKMKTGDRYELHIEDGALRSIEVATSPLDVYIARRSAEGGHDASIEVVKKKVDTVRRIARLGCVVTDNLSGSLQRCGGNGALARRVISLLGHAIDFYSDLRYGDELRLLVEEVFVGDEFIEYGRVLGIEYAGKIRHKVAYYYESPDGDWEYYDENGESIRRTFLRSPLKFRRISSGFNPKRFHPVLHKVKAHLAIDYAAPVGTPVWAYAGGVVTYVGRAGASGNLIKIKHKDKYSTVYAHLSRFASKLKRGDRVNQGEVIGFVGATGRATGPHLHFALKQRNRYVNPFKVENPALTTLPEAYRKHFDETVSKLQKQLEKIRVDSPRVRRTS